jgi:hypothetical protein
MLRALKQGKTQTLRAMGLCIRRICVAAPHRSSGLDLRILSQSVLTPDYSSGGGIRAPSIRHAIKDMVWWSLGLPYCPRV